MDNEEAYIEQKVPSGVLTGIKFKVLSEEDAEKASVKEIVVASEVTDPALGFPNPASRCLTCGAKDYRTCEGHLGLIKFPFTILHPYFLPEVAQILNKICPGCKTVKNDKAKKSEMAPPILVPKVCKYCDRSFRDVYPPIRFKVSTKDVFGKTAIIAEIKSSRKVTSSKSLPPDYWDFVPSDIQQDQAFSTFNRRVLTHAQVYQILKDVDPSHLKVLLGKKNKIFLQNFPLTPNCHRVAEFGQNLTFDIRTRAYRKMIGFRGTANELSSCVIDCIKLSKIRAEKPSLMHSSSSNDENPSKMHGLKYVKEVTLGKRTDFCFRMVCIGDPYIKLDEIGIPQEIAEAMLVSEQLNSLNWDKINASCGLRILKKGETFIRRNGRLVPVRYGDNLHIGDTVYRPLTNGDIVLINRPPSIHPHSLIALRVMILPVNSVLSINPLICNPLRGDFDGDSLHGYIPQSLESRVELRELVSLEQQLADKQSGENLLALSHDSLTAAHLMLEDGVFFGRAKVQQLQMFCPRQQSKMVMPAVTCKNNSYETCLWTGRQLFSVLLGKDFDLDVAGAMIKRGEFVNSENPSGCLREPGDNIYSYLIKNFPGHEFLEFLHSFQELLIEWLSMRGFSVSLLDLYLSHDSQTNMKEEVLCGLHESERQAHGQLLMVEEHQAFLSGNFKKESYKELESEKLCHDQQTSAALSVASASAFKEVFRDVQNLIYSYAPKENSFVSMLKAGSKGNMLKFVQHSMCLGYQHSLVPLSFCFPRRFSCGSWNEHRRVESSFCLGVDRYVPYGVVESSFLSGLNPLELFVHSVTNRDASFGGHADISGTMFRKLMFFMRDLFVGYDGTVRSCYGNQLVQFSYNSENAPGRKKSLLDDAVYGEPVGALAACAISEAAYGALDQPISALENSPLLNLKKVLECGVKKLSGNKTASLYLSKKLKRWTNGFEYGALEVKNHLEKLLFQDVVSLVTIFYTPKTRKTPRNSPWICYFRISKEAVSRKQLKVQSIINALKFTCTNSIGLKKSKLSLPKLQIATKDYPEDDVMKESDGDVFITAQILDGSTSSLSLLQDVVVPFLLQTIIKGSSNVKKVDISWKDSSETPKSFKESSGELYLRVFMSENCERKNFWRFLTDDCLQIMDMIDWERSHPDDIQDVILAQGIDAARNHFLSTLKSAISDTGKNIVPEHLALAADCLSATGEFVPINAKGLSMQRKQTSVSSPFSQACFSNPSDCFVKAAKARASDKLEGTIDALSWGKVLTLGTGGRFDILFSGKEHEIDKPQDVYSLLSKSIDSNEEKVEVPVEVNDNKHTSDKKPAPLLYPDNNFAINGSTDIMKIVLKKHISSEDIKRLSKDLKHILYKYDVNHKLSQDDKLVAWKALLFHPRRDEKIGIGLYEIKVGNHSKHGNSRCFILERVDGTLEDFSYHKCIHHALKLIAPDEAKLYQSRWLNGKE